MDRSDESRLERKAAALRALQKLAHEFPLQARIEGAQPPVPAAYSGILGHWVREAPPPGAGIAPRVELDALAATDAIVIGEQGIGCYPFSARQTGIRVHFSRQNVHAMCAIDAFAIPRMVRHAARITARCVVCRCHLVCAVATNGSVEREHQNPEAARVVWEPVCEPGAGGRQACWLRLCAGIGFVCRHCTASTGAAFAAILAGRNHEYRS